MKLGYSCIQISDDLSEGNDLSYMTKTLKFDGKSDALGIHKK